MLADELAALATPPEYIAMDIKLPSATGGEACWDAHAAFLAAALAQLATPSRGDAAAFAGENRLRAKRAWRRSNMRRNSSPPAATISPACCSRSPCAATARASAVPSTVLEAQRRASAYLSCVRVIPQTHVLLGQW